MSKKPAAALTEDEVRAVIVAEAAKEGSVAAWASKRNVSGPYVRDVLNGYKAPGRKILDALGLRRITLYEAA